MTNGEVKFEQPEVEVGEGVTFVTPETKEGMPPLPGEEIKKPPSEADIFAAKFIVKTGFEIIGNAGCVFTKVEECKFTDMELERLGTVWAPLIPTMSPAVLAALITTIILAGKAIIVFPKWQEQRKKAKEEKGE